MVAIFADDTKATKKDPTKSNHLEANANLTRQSQNLVTRGTYGDCMYLNRYPPMFETFIGINSVNGTGRIGGELLKPTQHLIL